MKKHNKAFGTDFETGIANSGSLWINCHCLHLGEAAQKIVMCIVKINKIVFITMIGDDKNSEFI